MSMPLIGLLFWLVMTVVGWLIWRSGDRLGGRMMVLPAAISSVGAAGWMLVSTFRLLRADLRAKPIDDSN